MNPSDDSLERLEQFLGSTEHQTKEEALAELKSYGVNIPAFSSRVEDIVRKGYQKQMKLAAQAASKKVQTKASRFGDLAAKSYEELLKVFDNISAGAFGTTLREAAVARCRNSQSDNPSETELRSWLEDISSIDNNEADKSQ